MTDHAPGPGTSPAGDARDVAGRPARAVADPPPTALAAVTHPDPYPYYAGLVVRRPLARDAALGLWVAASAEAVTAVLTSERCRVRPVDEPVPTPLLGSAAGELFARLVRMNDGPRHAALKPAIDATLGGVDPARVRTVARRWSRTLADEMAPAAHPERATDFAYRLTASVVAEMLGFAPDVVPGVAELTAPLVRGLTPGADAETVRRGSDAVTTLLHRCHAAPAHRDGLLGRLVRHAGGGVADTSEGEPGGREPRLDASATGARDDVVANAVGFLSQSYDATAGLIGNTLVALSRSSALRTAVRANPETLAAIVAEVARHDAPVQNTRRFVAADGLVAGTPMHRGDAILVVLAAANRDPAANADPDRFDERRAQPRVFTFGIGPHACPGAALAITIAHAGVEGLLEREVALDRLAERVTYRPSPNARIPVFAAL